MKIISQLLLTLLIGVAPWTITAQTNSYVNDFGTGGGQDGWKSDDTRNSSGTDLVGSSTVTHAPLPGATPPSPADADTQISNQISWGDLAGSRGALGGIALDGTSSNAGKSSISIIDTAGGFGSGQDFLDDFTAQYRWLQTGTGSQGAALKIGLQSTDFTASQSGFTATRSGEPAWDLVLVAPASALAADGMQTESLDASTTVWTIFDQSGNDYYSTGSVVATGTLEDILDGLATMGDDATIDATQLANVVGGAGSTVSSVQLGIGSGQANGVPVVDWLQVNNLNDGKIIDFVDASKWTGGASGSFTDNGNWENNAGPSPTQNVVFSEDETVSITVGSNISGRSVGIGNGDVTMDITEGITVDLAQALSVEEGASLEITGGGSMDVNGLEMHGDVNLRDGTLDVDNGVVKRGNLVIGSAGDADDTGTMTLSSGQNVAIDSRNGEFTRVIIGNGGNGVLNIEGGTLDLGFAGSGSGATFRVGAQGGTAIVNHSSGTVTSTQNGVDGLYAVMTVGQDAGTVAEYNQTGGTVHLDATTAFLIGYNGGTGTYNLSNDAEFIMGGAGSSFFGGTGGGEGTLNILDNASFSQTLDVQHFFASENSRFTINQNGAGTDVHFQGNTTSRAFWVGEGNGGVGTYNLMDGDLSFDTLNIRWGNAAGSQGIINQTGGTMTVDNSGFALGVDGSGEYNISGGVANFNTDVGLASEVGSSGVVNQTGGTVNFAADQQLRFNSGTSAYNLDGGTLNIGGEDGIAKIGENGSAEFNMGGGTLRVVHENLDIEIAPNLRDNTNSTFDTNGFDGILQNGFTGDGGFTKTGAGNLQLGGTMTLVGNSFINEGRVLVGGTNTGPGTMTINSGTTLRVDGDNNETFGIGRQENAVGTLNLNGGTIILDADTGQSNLMVGGNGGTGVLNMTDGTILGRNGSSQYSIFFVGTGGPSDGTVNQSGGLVDLQDTSVFLLGYAGEATAEYNLSGDAQFLMSGAGSSMYMGSGGADATMNIADNASFKQTVDVQSYMAYEDSTATFNQTGAGSEVLFTGNTHSRSFYVGQGAGGVGTYNLEAGTLTFDTVDARWGNEVGGQGIINQSGGALISGGGNFSLGVSGSGEYNISDGMGTFNKGLKLANNAGATGTVNQTGGGVTIGTGQQLAFGNGTGTYNLDGGNLNVGGTNGITKTAGSTALLSLGGGNLNVVASKLTSSVNMEAKENTSSTIDTGSHGFELSGQISGSGTIAKAGSGVWLVSSNSSGFQGTTHVDEGTLALTGSLGGQLIVDTHATLIGDGAFGDVELAAGGQIAPGNSIGTLAGESLTWNSDGTAAGMLYELSQDSDAGDMLSLSGQFLKGNGTEFLFDFSNTGTFGLYTLVEFGSTNFEEADFGYTNLAGGLEGNFVLSDTALQLQVVPEPSAGLLIVLSLTLAWAGRRRRRD